LSHIGPGIIAMYFIISTNFIISVDFITAWYFLLEALVVCRHRRL
jgi:hypothetical protein